MSIKELLTQELEGLSERELQQVAEYVTFLKLRSRLKLSLAVDDSQMSELYSEFAAEDRELAEEGIADYFDGLQAEDEK